MFVVGREQYGDVVVFRLTGRLGLVDGVVLKDHVKLELEGGTKYLCLGMAGVDFINSCGLGALVSVIKMVKLRHGRLTLCQLRPYSKEIFEITQLVHIFDIYKTEKEAIDSYFADKEGNQSKQKP